MPWAENPSGAVTEPWITTHGPSGRSSASGAAGISNEPGKSKSSLPFWASLRTFLLAACPATPAIATIRARSRTSPGHRARHCDVDANAAEDLRSEGISESALEQVYAPLGIDIGSKTVPEIAVSICAELIAHRNCDGQVPGRTVGLRGTAVEM